MTRLVPTALVALAFSSPAKALQQVWGPVTYPEPTAPYDLVSQRSQDFTLFNVETTRGLAFGNGDIYAINTHGSQLVRIDVPGFAKTVWPTLMNPIAVAYWNDGAAPDKVLVLGGATHALAVHDALTGRLVRVVDLHQHAPEPGDVVVDPDNGWAYVSSMAYDQVARIDLADAAAPIEVWTVDASQPRFLHLDRGDPGGTDNVLYVAPFLSGNNTISVLQQNPDGSTTAEHPNRTKIISLDGADAQLPDEDLFRITPQLAPGAAEPVFRGASTLLTAHGRHPSGKYWMLGVDLRNADAQTESGHKGTFARNEIVVSDDDPRGLLGQGVTEFGATAYTLDEANRSASGPWDLVFDNASGSAFVSSPTGDEVWKLTVDGTVDGVIDLDDGTIPRSLILAQGLLGVYCWGTNDIRIYGADPLTADPVVPPISLGLDPTPATIALGREIFYDADRSSLSRTSCGTCHPGGGYDGLAWGLETPPRDHKDVMVTQSLKSIADTFPFHWRGERELIHFNEAFVELLGGGSMLDETSGGEFDLFEDFVFALQSPANPNARLDRRLPLTGPLGSPADGQDAFGFDFEETGLGIIDRAGCVRCHTFPNGTTNDMQAYVFGLRSTLLRTEVAHLRDLSWKDQPAVEVRFDDPFEQMPPRVELRARGGYGLFHMGLSSNIAEAMIDFQDEIGTDPAPTDMSDQQRDDIAAFLRMYDRGISRAVHQAFWIDASTTTAHESLIDYVLLDQVRHHGWCDVVVIGSYPVQGTLEEVVWHFDPTLGTEGRFAPDHATLQPVELGAFFSAAASSGAANAVIGVPHGMGRYLGGDFDYDGAPSHEELAGGTDPYVADAPAAGTDFAQVTLTPVYTTSRVAVFLLSSPEPVRYEATWYPQSDTSMTRTHSEPHFARLHTVVLQGLNLPVVQLVANQQTGEPVTVIDAQPHELLIEVTDQLDFFSQLDVQVFTPTFSEDVFASGPLPPVVTRIEEDADTSEQMAGFETVDLEIDLKWEPGLAYHLGGQATTLPLSGYRVIGQVLQRHPGESEWTVVSDFVTQPGVPLHFTINDGNRYDELQPGGPEEPYYVSEATDSNGTARILFFHPPVPQNGEIAFNVVAILPDSIAEIQPSGDIDFDIANDPTIMADETDNLLSLYKFSATAPELRWFTKSF